VHAFDVLGDPVRRRILELLASGERSSGAITEIIRSEFGISQPAVSQHLRVLREAGLIRERRDGTRRLYSADTGGLNALREYLEWFWDERLETLKTEAEREERKDGNA
jgi:DNA-binding transcriptional ArsR family regulator